MLQATVYLYLFGKNDNFNEQLPKKEIYQGKNVLEFDLSSQPTISTKTVKNGKTFVLKTKYPCNGGFISIQNCVTENGNFVL